jgi:hypothetical protein
MLPIVARASPARPSAVTSPSRPAGLPAPANRSLHTLRMDRNAYRDGNDTGQPDANQPDANQSSAYQPDAYWRRRVITLCAGLVLLGLLAWDASVASPVRTFKLAR